MTVRALWSCDSFPLVTPCLLKTSERQKLKSREGMRSGRASTKRKHRTPFCQQGGLVSQAPAGGSLLWSHASRGLLLLLLMLLTSESHYSERLCCIAFQQQSPEEEAKDVLVYLSCTAFARVACVVFINFLSIYLFFT